MAYKFQLGPAEYSGSVKYSDTLIIEDGSDGSTVAQIKGLSAGAAAGEISGSALKSKGAVDLAAVSGVPTLSINASGDTFLRVSDATPTLNADSILFYDAGDAGVHRESLADLFDNAAGSGLSGGSDGTFGITTGGVTSAMIANGAIVNADVNTSAGIEFSKLEQLTSANIIVGSAGNVPTAVATSGDVTISNTGAMTIGTGVVETAMLADNAVNADKLANDAVDTAAIVDLNVTTAKLAANAVTAAKLADDAVDTAAIVDANVTTAKLADDAVTAAKLADNAVDTAAIVDLNVTTGKIANAAVTATQLATSVAGDGLTGGGGTALAVGVVANTGGLSVAANDIVLNFNQLDADVAVAVATDKLAFLDASSGSNASPGIVSIADFVTAIAGGGLDATSGVLSVEGSGTPRAIGDLAVTLTEAMNFQTSSLTGDRVLTLPAGSSLNAGSTFKVKAGDLGSSKYVITPTSGDYIDGVQNQTVELETNNTAVNLMFVGNDRFIIF